MRYTAIQMPDYKSKNSTNYIDRFLGCDFRSGSLLDNIRRSPDAINMDFGEEIHTPVKRTGYTKAISRTLDGRINGFHCLEIGGTEHRLIHAGTKLYRLIDNESVEIFSDMADAYSNSFTMNNRLYILDGKAYLVFNGLTISKVGDDAYVPATAVDRVAHESPNRLTGLRRNIFHGNAGDKLFTLDAKDINDLAVHAYIDGSLMLEGSGLTVNRQLGYITLSAAPANGAEVTVQFSKTDTDGAKQINRCHYIAFDGEKNDTRIVFSGNPDTPQTAYQSGSLDPTYFPNDGDLFIDSNNGCVAPRSLCRFEDERVFLTPRGVCAAVMILGEQRIQNRSVYINRMLTVEENLQNAISVVIKSRLYLFVNNNVYAADGRLRQNAGYDGAQYEWHRWTGIPATAATAWGERLWFGTADGNVYRFMTKEDDGNKIYNDDGTPVRAHWATPFLGTSVTGGGNWSRKKSIRMMTVVLQPFHRSCADIYAARENEDYQLIKSVSTSLLDFSSIDFSDFIFSCINRPRTITIKNAARRFESLQLMIKSDRPEGLGLTAIEVQMSAGAEVKGE